MRRWTAFFLALTLLMAPTTLAGPGQAAGFDVVAAVTGWLTNLWHALGDVVAITGSDEQPPPPAEGEGEGDVPDWHPVIDPSG